jgi:hypothetical protein
MSIAKHHRASESVRSTAGDKVKPIRSAQPAYEQPEPSGADVGTHTGSSNAGSAESLECKLARFDPALHGGEAMAVSPVGREKL